MRRINIFIWYLLIIVIILSSVCRECMCLYEILKGIISTYMMRTLHNIRTSRRVFDKHFKVYGSEMRLKTVNDYNV